MALSDPQTITYKTVATPLPRTGNGPTSGVFNTGDNALKLTASHTYGKRTRRQIRLDHKKIVPDALTPASNVSRSVSFYLVADVPVDGYSVDEQKDVAKALTAWLGVDGNITKFLGGES